MLRLTMFIVLAVSLAGCGTRLNPFNWFGGAQEERIEVIEDDTPLDARGLVSSVVSLNADALPGNAGAIIRAVGLPPSQGFWDAELVEVERTEQELIYEFRVFPPIGATRVGPEQSREIVAAVELNSFELAGVRSITVRGAQNQQTVRR